MSQLGSNVWVNLFIAMIFFVFGASLLGAFEITMPSRVVNSLNNSAQGGGTMATLTMGLVFALASFACTGPFVGALLAGSVSGGSLAWPIFGMLMFSAGLALPFFFLALFPSYLNKLPKSGGWLARTKAVMGFVIVAVGVKYLSNVDQIFQLELLSRERFLAIWIVLFSLAGLYLLGLLRFEHDTAEGIGLGRLMSGAVFLVFAVSLIPGMFGGRLGDLDAYVPAGGASFLAAGGSAPSSKWIKERLPGRACRGGFVRQGCLSQLHRLHLLQLQVDESKYVYEPRDRRRNGRHGSRRALQRRLSGRGNPKTAAR